MARLGSAEDRGYLEKRAFARVLMTLREEQGMTQETLAFESGTIPIHQPFGARKIQPIPYSHS